MKFNLLPLFIALAISNQPIAMAQENDPGSTGVIDGSDVRQFLDSGPRFSPTRMEEASKRFDKMIKMPPRSHQAKSWDEVIRRDDGLVNQKIPRANTASTASPANQKSNSTTISGAHGSQKTSGKNSNNKATKTTTNNQPQEKHKVLKKVGRAFERTAEAIGFPVADEFLPGDVDAKLSGDLPAGNDPRKYVHPKLSKKQLESRKNLLDRAENRGASAEDVLPQGNDQDPAIVPNN